MVLPTYIVPQVFRFDRFGFDRFDFDKFGLEIALMLLFSLSNEVFPLSNELLPRSNEEELVDADAREGILS